MQGQRTPSASFSKMQVAFIASSTLKRNKRYLDIEKINSEEERSNIKRRKPVNLSSKSIEAKINRSFSNSTTAFTQRLQKDIDRFRSRFNSNERPATARSFYQRPTSPSPSKTPRGVGIGQHLSRQQFYKRQSKPILDERLFNNYKMNSPDTKHVADLGRGPERNFDNSLKHINDIEYNTQGLYQDNNFKRTTMDCRFHYKRQKDEEGKKFFDSVRPENKPSTDLSPEAVERAMQTVRVTPRVDSFFMNSGRELPCQFEQRSGTELNSHWRDRKGKIERPNVEYSVRSMKERLCDERKERISSSKRPHFNRNQLCDKKYFIVHVSG